MSIGLLAILALASFMLAATIARWGAWKAQQENGTAQSVIGKMTELENVMRYLRRGRYSTERVLRSGFDIVSGTARRSFVFLFPRSKKFFSDINPLTGLEHGPSSYFLMEISAEAKKGKSVRRTKKNV